MNKKKKILKILAAVVAFILIGILLYFANAFLGNPISYLIVKNSAERILEENYPDTDYEIESISYFFKDTKYKVDIVSPTSIDSRFSMKFDFFGELKYDNYESKVLHKGNIRERIEREYAEKVISVLETQAYPYETGYAFGRINFAFDESVSESDEGIILYDELEADKVYDMKKIGEKGGIIELNIFDEVTVEKAAEILEKTKQMLNSADVCFYSVNLFLMEEKTDTNDKRENYIQIKGFLATDIGEEDLIDKINLNIKEAEDYYNESDNEEVTEIEQYENELISESE